ncbi:right-handed parallel beta-helix repeat-containing protein [Curtobacterium sp. RRHDQ66]|uniref:right-handed parallel beta-helix repeat-containing protein n=1 Tax=Curtobacterium guangdongense TaxID=3413380 RepID=UPI003BF1F3E7
MPVLGGEARHVSRRAALLGMVGAVPGGVAVFRAGTPTTVAETTTTGDEHTDVGAVRLQDLLDRLEAGAVVHVTRHWTLDESLRVERPMTIRFVGGSLSTACDIDLVLVTSSDVRMVDAVLTGGGADHSGLGRGIRALGTVAAPLRNVQVVRATIRQFSHDGVLYEHCTEFVVTGSTIEDVGYAGVLLFSCVGGSVTNNRIARVVQPAPYVNSYGIEAVRATSTGLDGAPRSARVLIADNHVSDVPNWEGIDTHGGESISILRNRVDGCRVGIAVVPSKDEHDDKATKYAPLDFAVVDNVVTRTVTGPGSGIVVRGAGETVGSDAERATGAVLRNTVTGYGDGDRDAAILVYLTRHLVIGHNRCDAGVRRGVSLYHSNDRVTLVGNLVTGLRRQGTATSVAVDVRATANSAVLLGNEYRAAGGVDSVYGVMCRQADNDLVLVSNDWRATTTAVVASTGTVVRYRET